MRQPGSGRQTGQYKGFKAATLFCPKCNRATQVRERLILVLPSGDKYAYFCSVCGTEVGSKLEKGNQDNPWTRS